MLGLRAFCGFRPEESPKNPFTVLVLYSKRKLDNPFTVVAMMAPFPHAGPSLNYLTCCWFGGMGQAAFYTINASSHTGIERRVRKALAATRLNASGAPSVEHGLPTSCVRKRKWLEPINM